ncbi:HipA-like protein [Opitutaceae bacterium TAV1]|nr:HipA-like protein [Opitutaceae bacterium TAV1]
MERMQVYYEGQAVGTLAVARGGIFFEYSREFIATGHELSPLRLPLGPGVRARDTVPTMRLPGLFEDSLPDRWGQRLMLEWFRRHGQSSYDVTPLMMLAYVGRRAMGALTYEPERTVEPADGLTGGVSLAVLHEAAERIERMTASGSPGEVDADLAMLARAGTSAGGARPKALIGVPGRETQGTRPVIGGENLPAGYEAWMVKFDTSDDGSAGPVEEAYARMARAAGIDMPATRLLETRHADGQVRRHFAVKRFDREDGGRIHHHTLAGMCHMEGGDLDYGILLRVTRQITRDEREVWRVWRRAVFNVLVSNRDDHGKNHGFIYHAREWHPGPAYDLTFASPTRLPERGMAVAGERREAGVEHLLMLAKAEGLEARRAAGIIDEVRDVVARWNEFANEAGVPAIKAAEVEGALRRIRNA